MRNRRIMLASGLLLAALVATPAFAQDMSGSWEITAETPRGSQTMTLVVEQSGSELTGTLTMTRMGGPPGGGGRGGAGRGNAAARGPMEVQISEGAISGGDFSFAVTMGRGDRTFTQEFTGHVEGDEMNGTLSGGPRGGEVPFTGVRESQP